MTIKTNKNLDRFLNANEFKQTPKKENTINLNDFGKWENQLPLYLDLYSKLTDDGKKEMKNQVSTLGKLVDIIQKAKNKGVK